MDKLTEARRVFDIEIDALKKTRDALDATFVRILDEITACTGKVIITGMGKPGHVATKLAATFSSLGTPAFCMHPAEAMHGDLGMVSQNDIVLMLSYSGESDEIISIIPNIKLIGAKIVALTGNENSTLAKAADITQVLPRFSEACYLGLAPTSSTTAEMVYGDALAVVASGIYGFKDADFGKLHPAGSLGKKLVLRVKDIMKSGERNATIDMGATLKDALVEISKKELGMVTVVDGEQRLKGIVTSGDIRRLLEANINVYDTTVAEVMNTKPIVITADAMAVDALKLMLEKDVPCLPVVTDKVVGTIKMSSILKAGIVDGMSFGIAKQENRP